MRLSEIEINGPGRWRVTWTIAACAMAWVLIDAGPVSAEEPAPSDPLITLNAASRAAYRRAKETALSRIGPVIFVEGDTLVLKSGDRRTEARYTPERYHVLKAFAHIPLALDTMLMTVPDGGTLDPGLLDELGRYRERIVAARERIAQLGLERVQAERQATLIDASLGFLDALREARSCRVADRVAFTRRMAPLVLANAAEATRAEIDALDRLVRAWKGTLTAADWERLTVVVMGRPLPRKDNLAVQYFARLLGEPGEGRRIVYAESLFDEPKALDLLATRVVDAQVGLDFFDDPTRMYRDLLGDAASAYLSQLFDRPGREAGECPRAAP